MGAEAGKAFTPSAWEDFFVAYSPERVDPGNPRFHTKNTPKVIGGVTPRDFPFTKTSPHGVIAKTRVAGGNPGFDQPVVRLGYTSMAIPASVYDFDVRTRELALLRRTPVLGGYDPAQHESELTYANAEDGTIVKGVQ